MVGFSAVDTSACEPVNDNDCASDVCESANDAIWIAINFSCHLIGYKVAFVERESASVAGKWIMCG